MNTLLKVAGYEMHDVLRGRWLVAYTVFFLLMTEALLRFGGTGDRALLSLMNLVLLVVPIVSLVFGTMHLYGAREFTELLLVQPISRPHVFGGLYLGSSVPIAVGFALGVGLPFLARLGADSLPAVGVLIGTGVALTLVFTAVAFLVAVRFDDRARGLGTAVLLWLVLAVVYDGFVLLIATVSGAHRIEALLLALMVANPLDLVRVLLLMNFDAAALMGYTGALFQRFFGSAAGTAVATAALLLWIGGPFLLGLRAFARKDL